jgi:hypothetical protein
MQKGYETLVGVRSVCRKRGFFCRVLGGPIVGAFSTAEEGDDQVLALLDLKDIVT